MGDQTAQDVLGLAEDSLAEALVEAETATARYHIRQAAQRLEMSRWDDACDR